MESLYSYQTPRGIIYIYRIEHLYYSMLTGTVLKTSGSPEQLASALADGLAVPGVIDTAGLGIPRDLQKWERLF